MKIMSKRLFSLLLVLTCLVLLASGALALAAQGYVIDWSVFASGGSVQSDNFVLSSAIGQPVSGAVAGENYRIVSGFRQEMEVEYPVFLPLTLR